MVASSSRGKWLIGVTVGLSAAIAIAAGGLLLRSPGQGTTVGSSTRTRPPEVDQSPSPQAQTGFMGPVVPSPLCGGSVSLQEAKSEASFKILVPNHRLASAANVTATYVCPSEVIIDFDSGIREVLEPQEDGVVPPWEKLAAQDPTMSLGVVRGADGLLADPFKDPDGGTPGGVEWVENGVLVAIAGNGTIPLEDLVAVAESLA